MALNDFHLACRNWFIAEFGAPTPAQAEAWSAMEYATDAAKMEFSGPLAQLYWQTLMLNGIVLLRLSLK